VIEHEFSDRASYRSWLVEKDKFRDNFGSSKAKSHTSSPFVWFSKSKDSGSILKPDPSDINAYLGGHDDTLGWCRKNFNPDASAEELVNEVIMESDGHTSGHNYDYDLVVIGGGSGGLAASKEAASLGAKVACLDYVKPSPAGSTWGLGGTCVNVGCIPKKLYHFGAQLRDTVHKDTKHFGIDVTNGVAGDTDMEDSKEPETQFKWDNMKDNIQNYIKSLNFKYRVNLREKSVTYLNKLATFKDNHTIECVDKKGRISTITASRFLIAVGGRPTPLSCEGGELAISSDDVFALPKHPGKTLCVGASYISLECAGFLAALNADVTVAVRSILLRGFDRECADKIDTYTASHGVKFKRKVTPTKLEKVDGEKIKVTFSDGSDDVYDTVLAAVGRTADTDKLLPGNTLGLKMNPKNKKVIGKNEQSSCPNIYAVGDVLDDTPELTPVAIKAGILLARRLFGDSKEPMDYVNICTTVFTPIEYACVGLSEEDAYEKYGGACAGKEKVEVYHSSFVPLEWSLSYSRSSDSAFAKVIVDKATDKVLGMHYVGPNAGEVMQGFGTSMKNNQLTYKKLTETVGIHPSSAEELVTLSVTKSSGNDAAAGGC